MKFYAIACCEKCRVVFEMTGEAQEIVTSSLVYLALIYPGDALERGVRLEKPENMDERCSPTNGERIHDFGINDILVEEKSH